MNRISESTECINIHEYHSPKPSKLVSLFSAVDVVIFVLVPEDVVGILSAEEMVNVCFVSGLKHDVVILLDTVSASIAGKFGTVAVLEYSLL